MSIYKTRHKGASLGTPFVITKKEKRRDPNLGSRLVPLLI
jgi:hypothetical protein